MSVLTRGHCGPGLVSGVCRWDQIQRLKDEKGHELLSTANVQSFLQSCEEAKVLLQAQLSHLDTVEVGCSSFTLRAEEENQAQALRDIQALEAKITYLKSVAEMYGSDVDFSVCLSAVYFLILEMI